nr:lipid IV(A) 3-deoxy-D-manno-octulosonic acid transferase [Campylobacter portucalensis]
MPFLMFFSVKKKYRLSIPSRFFLYKNSPLKQSDVHFHACSFGEINSLEILSKNFNSSFSVITQTGLEKALKFNNNSKFLPFELFLPFWLSKSKVLVIFEAELWLNLVKYAKKNGAFVILLNARISDKSYKKYLKFKFYYKQIFNNIDLVLAQSNIDEIRLKELGAKNIKVVGNIKSANLKQVSKIYPKFKEKLIIVASSHDGEEELILKSIKPKLNQKFLIAPRHPERFKRVSKICEDFAKRNSLKFEKFSSNLGLKSDIILLDTMNELINFYKICDVVILCGSFIDGIGGHNPIEIAQFNKPIISGKFFYNQKTLYDLVGGIKFTDLSNINDILSLNLERSYIKNSCNFDEIVNLIKEQI